MMFENRQFLPMSQLKHQWPEKSNDFAVRESRRLWLQCRPVFGLEIRSSNARSAVLSSRNFAFSIFIVTLVRGLACSAQEAHAATHNTLQSVAAFTKTYCVECHNAADMTAGLNLEDFGTSVDHSRQTWDSAAWEKIVKRLRARQMPPAAATHPADDEYQQTIAALESVLDQAAIDHPQPGRTDSIRRLNRTEYHNAVRDLLALDVDVNSFLPADESGHGFDNVTVGNLPPVLLNRYITAAEQISRLAVGRAMESPAGINVRVPADRTQEAHVEGLPLGTRGGTIFEYQFPSPGEYEIQLRLTRDRDENLEGLNGTHDIDVLIDRQRIHRFTVSKKKKTNDKDYEADDSSIEANLKKRFNMTAGPHTVGVTFQQTSDALSEIKRQPFEASFNRHRHPRRNPAIFEVSIVGPLNSPTSDPDSQSSIAVNQTPSQRQIFVCSPATSDEAHACAEKILRRLARLAYRRPVTESDLAVPMRFFEQGMNENGFEAGIESALSAILVNPYFLFRSETQPADHKAGTVYQISDVELASRLSFFLWSSLPDDQLLTLAEQKRLHEPDILREQVLRMLSDDRSQSLVNNFAAQWLYLRNLDSLRPDMRLFPDFDDNLRLALRRETEMLFEYVLREDRSVLELLNSDTTFLNERLARHYGIPGVIGSQFRPVKLDPAASHRGGLLRHGSILAVTSYATRTSPTIRGNWILGNILGTPPAPPPPNVPSLKEKVEAANLTIRERLAEHRANTACASCHDLMDPVGFSLENFDAVGRWRNFDEGQAIDASGTLPDGTNITNFAELESNILKRPEIFVGTMTEKMLTYALGRGIQHFDAPAVRQVVRGSARYDFQFSSLIIEIVSSVPFQQRVVE